MKSRRPQIQKAVIRQLCNKKGWSDLALKVLEAEKAGSHAISPNLKSLPLKLLSPEPLQQGTEY